jgi:hypothetical protein
LSLTNVPGNFSFASVFFWLIFHWYIFLILLSTNPWHIWNDCLWSVHVIRSISLSSFLQWLE